MHYSVMVKTPVKSSISGSKGIVF